MFIAIVETIEEHHQSNKQFKIKFQYICVQDNSAGGVELNARDSISNGEKPLYSFLRIEHIGNAKSLYGDTD